MTSLLLRAAISLGVIVLLARTARVAWSQRALITSVWRAIRFRHVAGSIVLLAVVLATSTMAILTVPILGHGLGDLFGTQGNAVLAPVGVAAEVAGVGTDGSTLGGQLLFVGAITLFLGGLAALLPWFAFVEEEVFRAGAEAWSLPHRVLAALVFGAAHLIMLVPVGATIGISVAGFVYGELYRRGVRKAPAAPRAALIAFRPTRRSLAAALKEAGDENDLPHVRRQVAGVHASTVWHTTFNTMIAVLAWIGLSLEALLS